MNQDAQMFFRLKTPSLFIKPVSDSTLAGFSEPYSLSARPIIIRFAYNNTQGEEDVT